MGLKKRVDESTRRGSWREVFKGVVILADRSRPIFVSLSGWYPPKLPEPLPLSVPGPRAVSHPHVSSDALAARKTYREAVCCIIVAAAGTYKILHSTQNYYRCTRRAKAVLFESRACRKNAHEARTM